MEQFVADWGYLAVFLGTFFEGETILVIGGFAAHQGLLALDLVVAAAFAGSYTGDQLWFWIGRRHGPAWLAKHPRAAAAAGRVSRLLEKWGDAFVLTFRFLYGLRAVSPVTIGLSGFPSKRFAMLNAVAAAVWAVAIGAAGFVFGQAVERFLGRLKEIEAKLLIAAALVALVYVGHKAVRDKLKKRGD